MATFEKRKKFKHFLFSPLGVLVLGVIVIFLGFSVFSVFQKREEARTNANTAQYEVLTLRESELKTQAEIDRLNTDAGVEEAIRNKYRAAKPGEGLVVITDNSRTASVAPATPVAQKKSWWQTFTSMFKKQ